MTSPQRRKGNDFELAVVAYLRENGHPFVERAYGAGRPDDVGDINGIVGWCLEAKAQERLQVPEWVKEAEKEAKTARCSWWAVIAKRRGKPVDQSYVVMPLAQFARLLVDEPDEVVA